MVQNRFKSGISTAKTRTFPGADVGSDHDLVILNFRARLTTVKKRKLQWYGYVTRASGLSETGLQGTVQGGRRRGSQRKTWIDNIAEWTGNSFTTTHALAHDRQRRRQLVESSSKSAPTTQGRLKGLVIVIGTSCLSFLCIMT